MDKDFGGILNYQNLNTYNTEALLDLAVKTYPDYDYEILIMNNLFELKVHRKE